MRREPIVVVFGKLQLGQISRFLTRTANERMLLLAGLCARKNICVPNVSLTVRYDHQSQFGISINGLSGARRLGEIGDDGHRLLATIHSHPGCGLAAVRESEIDRQNQDRLEQCGYSSIAGIVSRDRVVRFFTVGLPFRVRIIGRGVEQLGESTFRLVTKERHVRAISG